MTAKALHPRGILLWAPLIVILAGAPVGPMATGQADVANSSKAAANAGKQAQTPTPTSGPESTGTGQDALAAHARSLSEYRAALTTARTELSQYSTTLKQARQALADYQKSASDASKPIGFLPKGLSPAILFAALISLLTGGLAGAAVTARSNRGRTKRDLTLTLLQQYLSQWSTKAVASAQDLDDGTVLDDYEKMASVKEVGDWLDTVAFLYRNKHTDKRLMRGTGFVQILKEFREATQKCCRTPDLTGYRKVSADLLKEWMDSWKNLPL